MNAIAINVNEAHDKEDKIKFKVSDTVKAAVATGLVGAVAGAAGMHVADGALETPEDDALVNESPDCQQEEKVVEADLVVEVTAEVKPDEVILEEPEHQSSADTDLVLESESLKNEDAVYQPFASNDQIEEGVLQEPHPNDVIIENNTEILDVIPKEDMICGIEEEAGLPDIVVLPDEDNYNDSDPDFVETDILFDLLP